MLYNIFYILYNMYGAVEKTRDWILFTDFFNLEKRMSLRNKNSRLMY